MNQISVQTPELSFSRERPDSEGARTLIQELDADLLLRYPKQWIHGLHPDDIQHDDLIFLVVRHGSDRVGCGALRPLEPGMAEVKRMFVRPRIRGREISRKILSALECSGVEEANKVQSTLPVVRGGVVRFEVSPLSAYTAFARLFSAEQTEGTAKDR